MIHWRYIIATVGIRTCRFRLCTRRPKHLKPNEFAYRLKVDVNIDQWKDRVIEANLPKVSPPKFPGATVMVDGVGQTDAERTLQRLG